MSDAPWIAGADGAEVRWIRHGRDPERAADGFVVTAELTGRTAAGDVWVSTDQRPGPERFVLGGGRLLEAVDRALVGARAGDQLEVKVPAAAAFGAGGLPARVPPDSDLRVEITVVDVEAPPPAAPPRAVTPPRRTGPLVEDGAMVAYDVTRWVDGALQDTTLTRPEPVRVRFADPPLDTDDALRGLSAGDRALLAPDARTVVELVVRAIDSRDP